MMFGGFILHWVQALLDYVVAFSVVGVAGIVRAPVHNAIETKNLTKLSLYLVLGTALGGMLRFVAHLLAGVVFFKEYAGDDNVWIYSIIYNCTYMLPAIILTVIFALILFKAAPKLLKVE